MRSEGFDSFFLETKAQTDNKIHNTCCEDDPENDGAAFVELWHILLWRMLDDSVTTLNVLHVSKHNPRPHPYYTEKGTFVKSLSAFFLHFFFVLIISASLQYRAFSSKRGRAIGRRVPWKYAVS